MDAQLVTSHISLSESEKFTFEGNSAMLCLDNPSELYRALAEQIEQCQAESGDFLKANSQPKEAK